MENKNSNIIPNIISENGDENQFFSAIIEFREIIFQIHYLSDITEKSLNVFTTLNEVITASMFKLDTKTFEFRFSNSTNNNDKEIEDLFNEFLEGGIVAESIDANKISKTKKEGFTYYLLPLIAPTGIIGIIVLKTEEQGIVNQNILNYCVLHSNQISLLIFNTLLNNSLNSTKQELEQKLVARTESLNSSKRELELILNSILTGVIIIDKESNKIIDSNYVTQKLLGTTKDIIVGSDRKKWSKNNDSEVQKLGETIIVSSEGVEIPVIQNRSELRLGSNNIILESLIDISDRKKYEKELENQKEFLNGVSDASLSLLTESNFDSSIKNAITYLGISGKIDDVVIFENFTKENSKDKFTKIKYHWKKDPTRPSLDYELSFEKNLPGWYELFSNNETVFGCVSQAEEHLKSIMEPLQMKSFIAAPILVNNKFWGFLSFDDLFYEREWTETEKAIIKTIALSVGGAIQREQGKLEIIAAKEKVEQADRSDKLKSEFLAQMSHEIRTPINTILNFSFILKDEFSEESNEEINGIFEIISTAGKRIIRTVDLILNMSEVQNGLYTTDPQNIDIYNEILKNIHRDFSIHADKKGLKLSLHKITEDTNLTTDSYTVTQIFSNIVDNAIKYTNQGNIDIIVSRTIDDKLQVSVKDTGIGISEFFMPSLFKPFSQEDQGYTRTFEGNGLGLSLIKNYCDLNNAKIDVESKKGFGSNFIVTFPNL